MNFQRYLLATLALFGFIFAYEMLVHNFLLMGLYDETRNVWRDFGEMEASIPLAMVYQFVLSAWTAFAFTQLYKEGNIANGLQFGLFFGVFAGILTSAWYLWLDVPAILSLCWFISGIGEGLGAGFVLGSVYRSQWQQTRAH